MENQKIINLIKSSFCNLTNAKIRNNFIEIITGYSTINSKFVSVFIYKGKNGKYIISDYGWLNLNYYETPNYDDQYDAIERVKNTYMNAYDIQETIDENGNIYYYKSTENLSAIPSLIFDVANFLVGAINSFCIKFYDEKEQKEKETFRVDANNFLIQHYKNNVKLRDYLRDNKNIKFNAIIYRGMDMNLLTYITGSTPHYFENDLRKSIVNFEMSERSNEERYIIQKISLINDTCEGFKNNKSQNLINLLGEKITQKPVFWSEKEKILEIID